jgi:hypothetical protein
MKLNEFRVLPNGSLPVVLAFGTFRGLLNIERVWFPLLGGWLCVRQAICKLSDNERPQRQKE